MQIGRSRISSIGRGLRMPTWPYKRADSFSQAEGRGFDSRFPLQSRLLILGKDAANGAGGSRLIASRRPSTTRWPYVPVVVFTSRRLQPDAMLEDPAAGRRFFIEYESG